MSQLIHDFIFQSAQRAPEAQALSYQGAALSYGGLAHQVERAACAWLALGLGPGERLAVYLEKREEGVIAMFGAAAAGAVFVPINPLLKPDQVAYILRDCNVRILVTSRERLLQLAAVLPGCADLRALVLAGPVSGLAALPSLPCAQLKTWQDALQAGDGRPHRRIDTDMAAILYTSGSTGQPKGVVLSHRNMVAGALSVAGYLHNRPDDRILCVLPLSFDYGLSQLTTAFSSGACAVLINHLLLRDIIDTVDSERITGLAAVPPLWTQLSQLSWGGRAPLRYLTNSGGALPLHVLQALRLALPRTQVYLMYGLTEAFRSTYLPPEEVALRPGSIGKAIPNADILVLDAYGHPCSPNQPGELVHRGALVALGYWNDPARTAERFRPLPPRPGLPLQEIAVWSGDTVRRDEDGYLYFIGRSDDMIKTSGYRVSPNEVEQVAAATGLVAEVAAFGVPDPRLGQSIALVATAAAGMALEPAMLVEAMKPVLPNYMLPARVEIRSQPLPRNPNGKVDRKLLALELTHAAAEALP